MSRQLQPLLIAATLFVATSANANASYCGAISYLHTRFGCEATDYAACRARCYTAIQTRQRVVFDQQQYTCHKTIYEQVYEPKTVTVLKYVPETRHRTSVYTVHRPVWESVTKQVPYTSTGRSGKRVPRT